MIDLKAQVPAFVRHLRYRDLARSSERSYRSHLLLFLKWLDASGRPFDFEAMQAYRDHRTDQGKSPQSLHLDFCALRSFCEWLREERGQDPPDPRRVKLPRNAHRSFYCPTDEEVSALFTAAKGLPWHPWRQGFVRLRALGVLATLAYTGVRHNELLALTVEDVLTDASPWRLRVRNAKGRQQREIPVSTELRGYLEPYLAIRAEWLEKHPPTTESAARGLWVSRVNAPFGTAGLEPLLQQLKALAGIEQPITAHSLRHWAITRLAAAVDVATAAHLAGHSSVATTINTYLRTDDARKLAAVETLGKTFRAPLPEQVRPVPAIERERLTEHWQQIL